MTCGAPPDVTARPISSARDATAVSASSDVRRPVTWLWKIAPRPAMPVAMPTWRNVELIPDAIPARAGATTPIAAFGDRRVDRPDPDAREDEPRQERRPVRARVDAAHEQQARRHEQQAAAEQAARGQPRGELARHRRGDERQRRHGQEAQARLERPVAEDRLQVEDEVEEHREHRGRQRERRDRGAAERRLAKQRQVEHRVAHAPLDDDEGDEQQRGRHERPDDERVAPAAVVALDEPEDEQEERRAERRQARASRSRRPPRRATPAACAA